ncbi:MAG: hypothetical protein AAF368_00065 [Planctomycetota bacterium]
MTTERPILFSGPLVRAILDGRKTETRRVARKITGPCPYGESGDRLWVRETFLVDDVHHLTGPLPKTRPDAAVYFRANGECCDEIPECQCKMEGARVPWRPSIHMPRWASRISLEVTWSGVERLQDMDDAAAIREGIEPGNIGRATPKAAFQILWDSIYDKRGFGWEMNPFVWVVRFELERVRCG